MEFVDPAVDPVPKTGSKSLRMDIQRMASMEKDPRPSTEDHALSPVEHETILGMLDQQHKKLMYSNSLKK